MNQSKPVIKGERKKEKIATKWGIAGASKSSHDFVLAQTTMPQEEHKIVAVAAREFDKAQLFGSRHKLTAIYGSYEELAKDPNVDVVFIGDISPLHYEICKIMLENGKPVLCEKPLTINYKQTSELISMAKEKKVFLMEAIWSRSFPAYGMLRREMNAGTLGEIVQVIANFGAPIADEDRVRSKELGRGSILDMAVYCLQFAIFVFGPVRPTKIVATGHVNEFGCDDSMACVLQYEGGKTAVLSTNSRTFLPNEGFIVGTKGSMKMPNFWSPGVMTSKPKSSEYVLPVAARALHFLSNAGLRYEAMEVRSCLKEGWLESPTFTHTESLLIAELEDELRKILGVRYELYE